MAKVKIDFVAALSDEKPPKGSHASGKVQDLFGDQPDVLKAILRARVVQKLSYEHIARVLSEKLAEGGSDESLGQSSIKTWLRSKEAIELAAGMSS